MPRKALTFHLSMASLCLLFVVPAVQTLVAGSQEESKQEEVTLSDARSAIDGMYGVWARARVAYDAKTLDSVLAPDFYVLLEGNTITRQKFLSDISQQRPGSRLTRFDPDILTVQRTDEEWVVVITEKLEFQILDAAGNEHKVCSFWITRDGWRREGDKWLVTYSEAIGHQTWKLGEIPPINGW